MNKKKKKNVVPKVEPINRNIEPEILGGDNSEFSGGNSDNFKTLDSLQAAGDPLPGSAAGDPLPGSAAGDPLPESAAGGHAAGDPVGDPVGDPLPGDPLPGSAAGDPLPLKKRVNLSKFPQWS